MLSGSSIPQEFSRDIYTNVGPPAEMRVLIVEQTYDGGHYLNFVRYLVQAFAPLGCEIVVAMPNPAPESPQFKTYLSPHQSQFQLEFIPSRDYGTSKWKMIRTDARVFRELIDRVKPDVVYVPTFDGYVLPSVTGWPSHSRGGSPCVRPCHGFTARRSSWDRRPLMG